MTRKTSAAPPPAAIRTKAPPHETVALRQGLHKFMRQPLSDFIDKAPLDAKNNSISVGAVQWGVYAFFDYDGEPIYVGQTRESLSDRIGRHLTNQRTDAVAMSVLDPFEVRSIKVWPLPEYQDVSDEDRSAAVTHLNALERAVFEELLSESTFGILNEKDPAKASACRVPTSIAGEIVPDDVLELRLHPDVRIARRAQTIARLAHIIAGRDVAGGLRRTLATQADRLAWLAGQRFEALGGKRQVETRTRNEPTEHDVTPEGPE